MKKIEIVNGDILEVQDLSNLPEIEKRIIIEELARIATKAYMTVFYSLGLESFIETKSQNAANGDEFVLSFKKVVEEVIEHETHESHE